MIIQKIMKNELKENDIKVARCYYFSFTINITDSDFDNTIS